MGDGVRKEEGSVSRVMRIGRGEEGVRRRRSKAIAMVFRTLGPGWDRPINLATLTQGCNRLYSNKTQPKFCPSGVTFR